jgi:hypothetical protein
MTGPNHVQTQTGGQKQIFRKKISSKVNLIFNNYVDLNKKGSLRFFKDKLVKAFIAKTDFRALIIF